MQKLLVLAAVGLALIGGSYYGLRELSTRAWHARRARLLELAVAGPTARRPWELEFEALLARFDGERLSALRDSAHRPYVAWGGDAPRALAPEERLWIEAVQHELLGLERVLDEVARLDPARENWGGAGVKLLALRELTNALVGQAWAELEAGDSSSAAARHARTLALLAACDDGTSISAATRLACESIVLGGVRAGLAFGLEPRGARAELGPWLARMAYDPAAAERRGRRDLALLATEPEDAFGAPAAALSYFKAVERAFEVARLPPQESPWADLPPARPGESAATPFEQKSEHHWHFGTRTLHQRAARARVAEVALAVASFQAGAGRFPRTLNELELEPALRLDPLTATPLAYWSDGREARIGPAAWGERVEPGPRPDESPYLWILFALPGESAPGALGAAAD